MEHVTIYTTPICGYCDRAKRLLQAKGVPYEEINVAMDAGSREEMRRRSGGRQTVPQIFVGGLHVGGSDELAALERRGKLDGLLRGEHAR